MAFDANRPGGATHFREITPGESAIDPPPRALYFGGAGAVTIVNADATTAEDVPVFAGGHMFGQIHKVIAADVPVYGYFDT